MVGLLAAGLDFDVVPEPAGVVVVAGDFFPGNFFVGAAEPKEAVGLDENFFRGEADFLGDEASAHEDGGEEGGFGAERLDLGDALVAGKVVAAKGAFGSGFGGDLGALRALLADDAFAAGAADAGFIGNVAEAMVAGVHVEMIRR